MSDNISEVMIMNKETNDRIVMIGQQMDEFTDNINNEIIDVKKDISIFRESVENLIVQVEANKKNLICMLI